MQRGEVEKGRPLAEQTVNSPAMTVLFALTEERCDNISDAEVEEGMVSFRKVWVYSGFCIAGATANSHINV